ncbi:phosphatase PAP2 family protein [Labrys sp. KB_33_2]|uniref:phosphatase PAP2 family protein n=1 Tax=Labrys sp. KB_33_2 TaxID=3237479 RepID=UPI003F91B189
MIQQHPERSALVAILCVAGAALIFAVLAGLVTQGGTEAFDRAILLMMRNPADLTDPLGPGWLEEMMRDFTGLGGVGVLTLTTLVVAGFLALSGSPRSAVFVILAIGSGILMSSLLKYGFDRPRPDLVAHGSRVYTSSFPSGHSFMSATVYFTLGIMLARSFPSGALSIYIMVVCTLLTFVVGISRVYLGVHWPTDVIAGWVIGAGWALFCSLLAQRLSGH